MKLHTEHGVKKLGTDRVLRQTVLDTVLANYEVVIYFMYIHSWVLHTHNNLKCIQVCYGQNVAIV